MLQVEDAITTSFQNFQFVVEAFDKSTTGSIDEVVCDLLPPVFQHLQELVEALQAALLNSLDPSPDLSLSNCFRNLLVKDLCQLFAQGVGLFQLRWLGSIRRNG